MPQNAISPKRAPHEVLVKAIQDTLEAERIKNIKKPAGPVRQKQCAALEKVLAEEMEEQKHQSLMSGSLLHFHDAIANESVIPPSWHSTVYGEIDKFLKNNPLGDIDQLVDLVTFDNYYCDTGAGQDALKLSAKSVGSAIKKAHREVGQLFAGRRPPDPVFKERCSEAPATYESTRKPSFFRPQKPERRDAVRVQKGLERRLSQPDFTETQRQEREAYDVRMGDIFAEMQAIEKEFSSKINPPASSVLYSVLGKVANISSTSDVPIPQREAYLSALDRLIAQDRLSDEQLKLWNDPDENSEQKVSEDDLKNLQSKIIKYRDEMLGLSGREFVRHPMVNKLINRMLDTLSMAAAQGAIVYAGMQLFRFLTRSRLGVHAMSSLMMHPQHAMLYMAAVTAYRYLSGPVKGQAIGFAHAALTPLIFLPMKAMVLSQNRSDKKVLDNSPLTEKQIMLVRALYMARDEAYPTPKDAKDMRERLQLLFPEIIAKLEKECVATLLFAIQPDVIEMMEKIKIEYPSEIEMITPVKAVQPAEIVEDAPGEDEDPLLACRMVMCR